MKLGTIRDGIRTWWISQGRIPGRRKWWVIGGVGLVILLLSSTMNGLLSLLISVGAAVGLSVALVSVRRKRAERGADPIGPWARAGVVGGIGAVVALIILPSTYGGIEALSSQDDPLAHLLRAALFLLIELLVGLAFLVVTIVLIVRAVKARSARSTATWTTASARGGTGTEAELANTSGATTAADSESLRVIQILRSPAVLNEMMYYAGLYVNERSTYSESSAKRARFDSGRSLGRGSDVLPGEVQESVSQRLDHERRPATYGSKSRWAGAIDSGPGGILDRDPRRNGEHIRSRC